MKKTLFTILIAIIVSTYLFSNGAAVWDAADGYCLKLIESDVDVLIENQVGIVKTTQTFKNVDNYGHFVKYAFPMYEDASATGLRWFVENTWFEAEISPTVQDTTMPGPGEVDENLADYLGSTPLFFNIEQGIQPDSLLIVELSYVQLLPYAFGDVDFYYLNDYSLIQTSLVDQQSLRVELFSDRTIDSIQLLSHNPTLLINDENYAELETESLYTPANTNYHVRYSLNSDELGLFGMSTLLPPDDVPDELGNGFFVFIAEPDPGDEVDVIEKVFTLVVDRSGSMGGNKIVQARNAASFIVENLNEGDRFNIVDFSSNVSNCWNEHAEFNPSTEQEALDYISMLYASGSTNISGAFDVAVPQFDAADDETANIIIFFTDGQATAGITETTALLQHVHDLINETETNINLFTFGIGSSVNTQLLTLLASQNNGLSEFLGSDELEEVITQFYLTIRNPVLLNTEMSFTPAGNISEVYPEPLPNLYQGQQMIVSGRYNQPGNVTVNLSGTAFGVPVDYEYDIALIDSASSRYQFLTKIWAKSKIEHLLIEYYSLDEDSAEAEVLREEIVALSIAYGVMTPFTSYTPPGVDTDEEAIDDPEHSPGVIPYTLLGNYPNPFNPTTSIKFQVSNDLNKIVIVKIYNAKGQLVKLLALQVNGNGIYEVLWNGLNQKGNEVSSGTYFYTIDFGNAILCSKMVMIK